MTVSRAEYYGNSGEIDSLSYLEFGSLDLKKGTKKIWGYWQDEEAYDLYMFSRYSRDLFAFRKLIENKNSSIGELNKVITNSAHDKILDYIFKYAGLITACDIPGKDRICESGSSLFGLIDESEALDYVLNGGKYVGKIDHQSYLCSDISEMMNEGAKIFHSGIEMSASSADTVEKLLNEKWRFKLFYGLSVSLRYALREASDLAELGEKSSLSVFNRISLIFGKTSSMIYGTGKHVYIISLPEWIDLLKHRHITAKYCTANMQNNKDGAHTVRASVVMAADPAYVENFIANYENCFEKCGDIFSDMEKGEWRKLEELCEE